jgi:hypothetical protein
MGGRVAHEIRPWSGQGPTHLSDSLNTRHDSQHVVARDLPTTDQGSDNSAQAAE